MSDISLEKIYEEFGLLAPENDTNANGEYVDIDSVIFDEMYKEAKKVEVSPEEADSILLELTGEIPLKEIHSAITKQEEPAPVKEEEPAPVKEEEPAPVKEEEPAPAEEEEPASVEEEEPAAAIAENEPKQPQPIKRKSIREFIYGLPKAVKISSVCALSLLLLFGISLFFRYDYTVYLGDTEVNVKTFTQSTQAIVNRSKLEYDENSKIEAEHKKGGGTITITEPFAITLNCDGENSAHITTGLRVDELLNIYNIELKDYDTVSLPLNHYIKEPCTVDVNRVTFKKRFEEEITPAPVEDKSDGADYTYTREGVDEVALVTYLDKYVNGEFDSTTEIARDITTPAQSTLILSMEYNGSLPLSTEIPTEYIRVMDIECTAYYLPGNLTATGKIAQRGYVAVDPTVIPLGTKMFICSADGSYIYGYAQAEDTGSAVKGNIVDLHLDSYEECIIFGRRDMIAYIIEE